MLKKEILYWVFMSVRTTEGRSAALTSKKTRSSHMRRFTGSYVIGPGDWKMTATKKHIGWDYLYTRTVDSVYHASNVEQTGPSPNSYYHYYCQTSQQTDILAFP